MKGSPFSIRDTIQYAIPLAVAVVLFLPFAPGEAGIDVVLVIALLFAYTAHSPMRRLITLVYRRIPILAEKERSVYDEHRWWSQNWDFDRLFYEVLTDKEREYVYLTGGYADMHRKISFVLLSYAAVMLGILVASLARFGTTGFATTVPIAGGWRASAALLLLAAAVLFWFSIDDYLAELRDVTRTYDRFARKYQRSEGDLARRMWGRVTAGGEPLADVRVSIVFKPSGAVVETATDERGRFAVSLEGAAGQTAAQVTADVGAGATAVEVPLGAKMVPEATIRGVAVQGAQPAATGATP